MKAAVDIEHCRALHRPTFSEWNLPYALPLDCRRLSRRLNAVSHVPCRFNCRVHGLPYKCMQEREGRARIAVDAANVIVLRLAAVEVTTACCQRDLMAT